MKAGSIACTGILLLVLAGCSKQESQTTDKKPADTAPGTQASPRQYSKTPAPAVLELSKSTVLDALKRSSIDRLPVFLKVADASFQVVNTVDSTRVIKGEVTIEFLESTYRPTREVGIRTPSSTYKIRLLKEIKKKGDTVALPFDARVDLLATRLSLPLPQMEDYGQELAKYPHSYPEGGEVATKTEKMVEEALDAERKLGLVQAKWDRLKGLQNSLTNTAEFTGWYRNCGNRGDYVMRAFDDVEFSNKWGQLVEKKNFNSWADRYAAHKAAIQARFDIDFPRTEKLANDFRDKLKACADYMLGL